MYVKEQITLDTLIKEELGTYENSLDNIQPYFDNNKNLIVLSSSDYYAKYASVVILSIIKNSNPNKKYDIAVLTNDMSIYNKQIILSLADNYENINIRIFNIAEKIENYTFYTWAHFTINTYFRLLIPLLFNNYEKVLYLDSDIVCNNDVAKLFEYDLGTNYLAAAKDTHVLSYCNGFKPSQKKYNRDVLKLKNPYDYYQMGVSIYNIRQIIKDFKPEHFIEVAGQVQYRWLDQDVLNSICQTKIKELPVVWNVMIANKAPYVDEYYLPENYRNEYCKARLNPSIVHYCGGLCFKYPIFPDLGHYFWKYARLSPYYEEMLKIKYDNFYNVKAWCLTLLYSVLHYKKHCLNYWRCKYLYLTTFGKKKNHYKTKMKAYKEQITIAKNIMKRK